MAPTVIAAIWGCSFFLFRNDHQIRSRQRANAAQHSFRANEKVEEFQLVFSNSRSFEKNEIQVPRDKRKEVDAAHHIDLKTVSRENFRDFRFRVTPF